ncbi:hypothetical protein [Brevibacillus sp. H7]|uniref:hypothetical protein n=1 Tax=Brevibacillus sp. H7 TaxID=3349138 RepID=UPI0037F2D0A7
MELNENDIQFIKYWENQDFTNWNEMDVREDFIAPLLNILGYSKRTINSVIREKSISLSTPYHRVGRKRVSIDYLPTIRLKQFWIIEAKPGTPMNMEYGDLLQAHLYAIHPEIQAKFIVLINGWEIRIYDALTCQSWDNTLLVCNKQNCRETFPILKQILSAKSMLQYQRSRIIEIARQTFLVEIDEAQVREFQSDMYRLINEITPVVRNNAREIKLNAWREQEIRENEELKSMDIKSLLICMDIPTNTRYVIAREYIRRIENADKKEKAKLIDSLVMYYRGRPHSIFRVLSVYILVSILKRNLEIEGLNYTRSVKQAFEELVINNLNYWNHHNLSNALCHLENTSLRLAKKLCLKIVLNEVKKIIENKRKFIPVEDLLREQPSEAKTIIPMIGLVGEQLWRNYSSSSKVEEIWKGINEYELIEREIDKMPEVKYSDGDADLLFFESYGKGFDMLFMGTWEIINANLSFIKEICVPEQIINIASLSREEALEAIPRIEDDRPQ